MLSQKFRPELDALEVYLRSALNPMPHPALERFWESMFYSLLSDGKRFRPVLSLLTAKAFGKPYEVVLPLAAAVELIHTYSLVHDDLPVMDNDDVRRGRPTNHKVYGDAMALLAGDGLLTAAFGLLAQSSSPNAITAVLLLSEAAGPRGMVGGQVLDIETKSPDAEMLAEIHKRKTGALIQVSVEAASVLCGATPEQQRALAEYGAGLGFAFQLADDLQDYNPEKPEKINFVSALGEDETRAKLKQVSEEALESLFIFPDSADGLRSMITMNSERV
ncbi:MAG: polyprenyl synthetase family protein [Bdellovibrionales bacterium]